MSLLSFIFSAFIVITVTSVQAETCIECHEQRDPELVNQWRLSGHGAGNCSDCHVSTHSAMGARKPAACTTCHAGPVEHSYRTSKHGVINRIEQRKTDWSLPLVRGNYRAPSCAYCHLYAKQHDTKKTIQGFEVDEMVLMCSGCHSPRYATEQLASGQRLQEIGTLKVNEAKAVIAQARQAGAPMEPFELLMDEMINIGMMNLRLGSGHQSPDYQWWHGQPALDGLLLRIKGQLSEFLRQSAD